MKTWIKLDKENSVELGFCKCGKKLDIYSKYGFANFIYLTQNTYCHDRRWFNFWKHDREQEIAFISYPNQNGVIFYKKELSN